MYRICAFVRTGTNDEHIAHVSLVMERPLGSVQLAVLGHGWDEVLQGHVLMEQVKVHHLVTHNIWGQKTPSLWSLHAQGCSLNPGPTEGEISRNVEQGWSMKAKPRTAR